MGQANKVFPRGPETGDGVAMTNLDRALDLILAHEGGWSDHPADRGGATKYGITHGTLSSARGTLEDLPENVRDLTPDQARLIYTHVFWEPSVADLLPWPVCYAQMDAAVQHGPGRAVTWLQRGFPELVADGKAGPLTRAAVSGATDWTRPLHRMLMQRAEFYIRILRDPSQAAFAAGWANRLRDVAQLCDRDLPDTSTEAPTMDLPEIKIAQPKPIIVPKHVRRLSDIREDDFRALVATSGRSVEEVAIALLERVADIGETALGPVSRIIRLVRAIRG